MTIREALEFATDSLDSVSQAPRREAEILLSSLLDCDSAVLWTRPDEEIDGRAIEQLTNWLEQRQQYKPLGYILGHQPFLGFNYLIDERVLIPRPETELLCETIIRRFRNRPTAGSALDIGTGSGVIAISLKRYLPQLELTAVDISPDALTLAEHNSYRAKTEIEFIESNLFTSLGDRKYSLIVANLPYVPTKDTLKMSPTIRNWEPIDAIDGGPDGLSSIRPLIAQLATHLTPGGSCYLEIWHTHARPIKELVEQYLPTAQLEIELDLAGLPRFAIINLPARD